MLKIIISVIGVRVILGALIALGSLMGMANYGFQGQLFGTLIFGVLLMIAWGVKANYFDNKKKHNVFKSED